MIFFNLASYDLLAISYKRYTADVTAYNRLTIEETLNAVKVREAVYSVTDPSLYL